MRPARQRIAGLPLRDGAPVFAAGVLCFCAIFFSRGFAVAPLVWIGGFALLLAAGVAAAALVGALPAPRLGVPAAIFLLCLFGLAVWVGATTTWSLSPERSWIYTNLTLVDAGFALLGVLVSALLPRTSSLAGGAAVLLGLLVGWALLEKCIPSLYSDYGRIARLRAPLTYWNELALLCDVAVPLALWLAAPPGRRASVRAAGALLLFGATVTVLLTYSRVGVLLACVAAAAWVVLDRNRVESLATLALGGGTGAAVFGLALALPGITKDGASHADRSRDGWFLFAVLVLVGTLVVWAAAALARLEERRPLSRLRRARVERVAALVAVALVLAGVGVSAAFAGRLWHEFANPVSSQIASNQGHLNSVNSSNRWRWWQEEWQAFTGRPLGGTGAGTFIFTDRRLRKTSLVTTTEPHNVPLQFLGETGIIGFLLYAGAAFAATIAIVRVRRHATNGERAAVTALGLGLAAFLAHMVVDVDWDYVATCGPLLFVAGALAARGAPAVEYARARHPLIALAGVLFALGAVYSLAAPWLAQRDLANLSAASAKRAHYWDPLSTDALVDAAAFEIDPRRAQRLYVQALSLEPKNSDLWYTLGQFYADNRQWRLAYDAFSKSWAYDQFGPAGIPCGALDQARHKALGIWPSTCPRGRLPAGASP